MSFPLRGEEFVTIGRNDGGLELIALGLVSASGFVGCSVHQEAGLPGALLKKLKLLPFARLNGAGFLYHSSTWRVACGG